MMLLYPPRHRGRQLWAYRVMGFLVTGVLYLSLAGSANAQLTARLEQASNGTPEAPISTVDWVTTTITAQRGHYVEGSSIPYRLVFETLLPGAHRVVIAWDTKTGGRHATDYLTHYNRLVPHNQFGAHNVPETIQPLRNISGGLSGPSSFPIPSPTNAPGSNLSLPAGQRVFHIYNGAITSARYVTEESLGNASAESRIAIEFTAAESPVLILFGGHTATKDERGAGQTAGGIVGLSYRMRIVEVDGLPATASVLVNAPAVLSPPTCDISGPNPVCPNTTNTYVASSDAASAGFNWTLTANTAGAVFVGPVSGPAVQVRSGDRGGSFTLQVAVADGLMQSVCTERVIVLTNVITSPLVNASACQGGTAMFSTVPSGSGPFTFLWRKGDTILDGETNSQLVLANVGASQAGLYCVEVTGPCDAATSCATLTIHSNTIATALANLNRCVGDGAVFSTIPSGAGPFAYRWRKNGVELGGQTNRILSIPNLVLADAGTYAVEVTGLCNSVTNSGLLRVYGLPACGIQGPAAICPDSTGTIFLAPAGMAEYRWRVMGNGAIVGPTNLQNVVVAGGAPGFLTVNLVTVNSNGCSRACSRTITVGDIHPPAVICPQNIQTNTEAGQCWRMVEFAVEASDDCSVASVTCNPPSGTQFPKGTTTVTCTAADGSGNQAGCSFTVSVLDLEPPAVKCPTNVVVSTQPGLCEAAVNYGVTMSDNCPGTSLLCSPPSGAVFPLGTSSVTCRASDAAGNIEFCSFDVTVVDQEGPQIVCPADITVLVDSGQCDAVVAYEVTVTDNCAMEKVTCIPPGGSLFVVGTTFVECVATDVNQNKSRCSFAVQVVDGENPRIVCPGDIGVSCDPGGCDAVVNFTLKASDNCPGVTLSCVPPSGTRFPVGPTNVSCTATDASGNTASCAFQVTVTDTERPVLVCPADMIVSTTPGRCDAVVPFTASATDNCPGASVQCVPPSGSVFATGLTMVNCSATDIHSNVVSCAFNVRVLDGESPTVVCPDEIVTNALPGMCVALGDFDLFPTDNCPGVEVFCDWPSGSAFPIGQTWVYCIALDTSGNIQECTFPVTVNDVERPVISCPADLVLNTQTGRCDTVATFSVTAGDNCGAVPVSCLPPSGSAFPKGTDGVTCTAMDASGNTATCAFRVIVQDREAPSVVCPPSIVTNSEPGRCDAVVTFAATATDNCPGVGVLCTPPSGTRFVVGQAVITCVATDSSGNTNRCSFTVRVQDSQPPTVTCPANIVASAEPGRCDAIVTFVATGNDNCSGTTVICSPPSGTRFARGATPITCTATDASGNTAGCGFSVTVNDHQAPVIVCPANIVTNTAVGRCDVVISFAATVTDNCAGATLVCTPPSGATFGTGVTPVNCVATDASGNTNRCGFSVTVQDRQSPVSVCPPNIVTNSEAGRCDSVVTFAASATDNCPDSTVACAPPSGSRFNTGQTIVTCVATDPSGNTNRCMFSVTVNDLQPPVVTCPANIVTNAAPGRCDAVVSFAANATDNCAGVTLACAPPSGTTFQTGSTPVNCVATDASGNTNRCSFTVTVQDHEPPAVVCPANIVTNTEPGRCDAVVTFALPASDNCPGVELSCSPPSGTRFSRGTTLINCTAIDASSNTVSCAFTVTVNDNQAPVANCPANIVMNTAPGHCDAVVSYATGVSDNCVSATVVCAPPSGATFAKGVTTVACVATDAAGNTNRCTFTVTVQDREAPGLVCPANIVTNNETARCDAVVTFTAAATDNCPGTTVVCSPPSGSRFVVGQTTVACLATDASGNTNRCTFSVAVADLEEPDVSCPADIVTVTAPGQCDAPVNFTANVLDNCLGATVVCIPPSSTRFPRGSTVVACTGTDASGNAAACAFTVTVNDNQPPVVSCPANIVTNTAVGRCDAVVSYTTSVSDNCTGVTVVCIPASGATFVTGVTPVTCVATDAGGNTNRCSFTVTVQDREKPLIACPPAQDLFTAPGSCDVVATFAATAADNCSGVNVACAPPSGSHFGIGTNTVTCTAADGSGNIESCSFTVTVRDTELPTLTCPTTMLVATEIGRCDAVVSFAPTVLDNCPDVTVTCAPPTGTRFSRGATTVNCAAVDASGNRVTCSFTVTVQDRENPIVVCPPNVVTSTAAGRCDRVVEFATTVTDNCGADVGCEPPSGSTFGLGTNTVTCTAIDTSGNQAVCAFLVTVRDMERPLIVCPGDITLNTEPGRCDGVTTFAVNATDNCALATFACVPPSGNRFSKGVTTVTCTATDVTGNTTNCSFRVTVNDTELPAIICPQNLVLHTEPSVCSARATFSPQMSDNCPGATVSCAPPSGSDFPIGITTVLCSVTDASGNWRSCAFDVRVLDAEPPRLICPGDLLVDTEPTECTATVVYAVTGDDACNLTNLVCVPPSGALFNKGITLVQCGARDASGNEATCAFNVTVRDSERPALLCPTNIVVSASAGRCDATVNYSPSVSDNCGNASVVCTPPSGATFMLGTTFVNCMATDDGGNTNQCTFTVRVIDSERPTVSCPENMVVNSDLDRCDARVNFAVSASDNCGGVPVFCTPASGSRFNLGVTPVTCSATDGGGNVGTCAFTITVRDNQNPVLQCPANIVSNAVAGRCDVPVTFNLTAMDNCGNVIASCFPPSGSFFAVGTTTVNCSAIDGNSNVGTCQFNVTVRDSEAPFLQCPTDMLVNTATGRCDAVVSFGTQVFDNCPGAIVACSPPSGTTFLKGTNIVFCTARDASSNSNTCTFRVIVRDVEKPQIVCPADLVASTDSNQCRTRVTFSATAIDNCNGASVACNPSSNSFFNKGVTTVICVATDSSGNTNRCSFTVTVNDTSPPNITCPANIITNAAPGQSSIMVQFAPVVSDNCPGMSYICTPQSGSVFQEGTTPVTCTATDGNGNPRSCSFTVTVDDTEPPVIHCPTNVIVATATGRCDAVAAYYVTASDNSQMVTLLCEPPIGSVLPKGATNVLCTATDPASNRVTCSFPLNVVDLELPEIACPTNMVLNTQTGRCDARVTYTTNATDNCSIASLTCNPPSGALVPKGTNTVTCTAIDSGGNTQLCAFTVRVVDNERPVITCPGKMLFNTPPGQCSTIVNFNVSVTDNCPGASVSCSPPSGSSFGKGVATVICTGRDTSGNTAACNFQVEVRDLESPVITCPADINTGSYPGACGSLAPYSVGVSDNCPGATVSCTPPTGSLIPVGTNIVTCNATDTSGNTATCSFRVTVRDTERPTLICPGDIIIDGSNGLCTPVATYSPTVVDNCTDAVVNCVPPSGTTFAQGTNRVVCTVTDSGGNMNSCGFWVIVRLQPLSATPLQSQTRCAGETASLTTSATGSGPLTFRWFKDGSMVSGPTNGSLILSNLTAANSGTYTVVVQGPCGSVTNSATLTVRSLVAVNGLTNVTTCDCDPLVLSPTVSGTGPYTYAWRKNGAIIPGAVSNTLAFAKISTNDAGLYTVEVSGVCNTASASASVGVISVPNPAIYTNSGAITIYDNTQAFPYPSSVRVTCVPQPIQRATVTLRGFTHSYPDDVDVLLMTPAGGCVLLMSDAGSGSLANNINITMDDSAAVALPDSAQLFTGTFRPGNYDTDTDAFPVPAPKVPPATNLGALIGSDANGFWSLFVVDDYQLDSGAINNGWVLRLYWESNPVRITNAHTLPSGGFQMTLIGDPQTTLTIQASSDLQNWSTIGTVTLNGPQADFIDPSPGSPRFYRALRP